MANPLQEQLLKAGLVSKDKLNKSNKTRHKQVKQQSKDAVTESDKVKQQVKQAAIEKAERDRELNRQNLEAENKKAVVAQIRQLVELNKIDTGNGEMVYNFEEANKIKHIYVTEDNRNKIVNGRLSIVRLDESYALIPTIVAEKIMQRDASFIVLTNEAEQISDEDDEYADYKVPDDLMW